MNPPLITMHATKHPRESAAKGDDQIAFENGTSCLEVGRYQTALEWYAEVKPNGGGWDRCASTDRVSLLVALHRAEAAVSVGMQAISRMQQPSAGLIAEVARALDAHRGPSEALTLCRHWLRHSAACRSPSLWFSAAAYASRCQQFTRSLRYLVQYLEICGGEFIGDLFLDRDFAPLWHHLEHEPLAPAEASALRLPQWQTHLEALAKVREQLSFESCMHVPPTLRAILRLNIRRMTWQPHSRATPSPLAAFASWCEAVRMQSRESLAAGLRKALAFKPATSGECA